MRRREVGCRISLRAALIGVVVVSGVGLRFARLSCLASRSRQFPPKLRQAGVTGNTLVRHQEIYKNTSTASSAAQHGARG
jgi:hypothetical protein